MSEKALVYLKDLDLKHKHLVIGEAAGMSEGNGRALLRQLLSEGKVKYATVQSTNKDGLTGSTLPTLEGPCGLVMTTTEGTLHHEDETRMLSLDIKESPDQIREALLAQAMGANENTKLIDLDPWYEFYQLVKDGPQEVRIPFARDIVQELPTNHDRIKRDFPQILSLISAHALIHSFDREWLDDNTVVANEDDYENVHRLINEPISVGLEATVTDEIRNLVGATKELAVRQDSHFGISQTRLADHLGTNQSAISRNVNKAVKAGYLVNENPGQGKVAKLTLGDRKLPSGYVLPKPEELFTKETVESAVNDNREPQAAKVEMTW